MATYRWQFSMKSLGAICSSALSALGQARRLRPGGRMNRRAVLAWVLTAGAAALPLCAWAQKSDGVRRIGIIMVARPDIPHPPPATGPSNPFWVGLAKSGYFEGKNLSIERRYGEYEHLPAFARELEALKAEVICVWGTRGARIVQSVVKKTPLVIYSCDPYEHVKELAHPNSNVTGTTCMTTELSPKRLDLLKELRPAAKRVAFFHDPEDAPEGFRLAKEVANRLGITIYEVSYKSRRDIPAALERVAQIKPDAVFVYPDAVLFGELSTLAKFWIEHSLPSMNAFPEFAYAGGLMAYGAVHKELFELLGDQVAQILDGAHPSQVPVRRATQFHLVINLKTAKALGVTVPQSLLLRADRVIE